MTQLTTPKCGLIAELGEPAETTILGGDGWALAGRKCDADPALLLTLDWQLIADHAPFDLQIREIPLFSHVNCDHLDTVQEFQIDWQNHRVAAADDALNCINLLEPEFRVSVPLPRTPLRLRPLREREMNGPGEQYYAACETLVGDDACVRILGEPLWLGNPISCVCRFGHPMEFLATIGYQSQNTNQGFLNGKALFLCEGALYFLICPKCLIYQVHCQSS